MSRHEITNDKGTWIFGWDQPLMTFFLQLRDGDLPEEENPVIWLGTEPRQIYEVTDLVADAGRNGLVIDQQMQATLYADKDDGR